MAKYQHFEELPVWQEAARLYNVVLDLLEESGTTFSPDFVINWIGPLCPSQTILPKDSNALQPTNYSLLSPSRADRQGRSVRWWPWSRIGRNSSDMSRCCRTSVQWRSHAPGNSPDGLGRWTSCPLKGDGNCRNASGHHARSCRKRKSIERNFYEILIPIIRFIIPTRPVLFVAKSLPDSAICHWPSAISTRPA